MIVIRVLLLVANIFLLTWIFGDSRLFFNQIILSLFLIGQVAELIRFVNHTNRELARFFEAIKHQDFSISFKQPPGHKSFAAFQHSLTAIIDTYQQVKIEKEAQFHFLQMLVNQLHIGIISLTNDNVVLINPTAERLLRIDGLKNWKLIGQVNPEFAREFQQLGSHDRKLIEVTVQGEKKILAVDVSLLSILDQEIKLITLQDINTEIEQKEIEAWHKLIRILTHEIMNSVTPISSLTETMQTMLREKDGSQKELPNIDDETIADILFSLNTIQHRSEGLLHFVENYRTLTRVPNPSTALVKMSSFLAGIEKLMLDTLQRQNINFNVSVSDDMLSATFDPTLIEQVIINLITNSIHAVEKNSKKRIVLKSYKKENLVVIEVTDNGVGIPEKELKEIFVPFFSTRKDGSGIGLSLSKQIVSLHSGRIKVSSSPGKDTTFLIELPRS